MGDMGNRFMNIFYQNGLKATLYSIQGDLSLTKRGDVNQIFFKITSNVLLLS